MNKMISLLLCGACVTVLSFNVEARGGGGGSGGGSGGFGGGSGFGHGPSSNSAADENSNGRFSQDRDTGLDRAEDRMSEDGLKHEKATDAKKMRNKSQSDSEATQLPAR